FKAEYGIRDRNVTGVQTCALPIYLIGVMVPQTDEIFFSSIIRGIEEVVKNSGYNIIILQSNDQIEDEIENINILFQTKVDGILRSEERRVGKECRIRSRVDCT